MNSVICIQSQSVGVLASRMQGFLVRNDLPITPDFLQKAFTELLEIDFMTLNPVQYMQFFREYPQSDKLYFRIAQHILDALGEDVSVRAVQVLSLSGPNITVSIDH
ncbi:hypothetical protein DQR70_05870 [Salmonella enterica subsp. enterica serovar Oslo]|nr:hypothetical protein [Salmonella enterica subsp. enterica serovar Oslo]